MIRFHYYSQVKDLKESSVAAPNEELITTKEAFMLIRGLWRTGFYSDNLILDELLACLCNCHSSYISSMSIRDGRSGLNEGFLYFLYSPPIVSYFSSTSSSSLSLIPSSPFLLVSPSLCHFLSRCFLFPSLSLPVLHFLPPILLPLVFVSFLSFCTLPPKHACCLISVKQVWLAEKRTS